MKKLFLPLAAALFFTAFTSHAQSNSEIVKQFLGGIQGTGADKISEHAPVASVSAIAEKGAAKTIVLTKENIQSALKEAKQYKTGIIVVGAHTFVKVTDFNKCSVSNSWGACMPYGEGYIKKGALTSTSGPINNIIGRPDDQVRTLYLFN